MPVFRRRRWTQIIRKANFLLALIALVASLPAHAAPSAQARAYIEARSGHVISQLNPLVARRTAGHNGKVIEWAGTLDAPVARSAPASAAVATVAAVSPAVATPSRSPSPSTPSAASPSPSAVSPTPSAASPSPSAASPTPSAASPSPSAAASPKTSAASPTPAVSKAPAAVARPPARPADVFATLHTHNGDTFLVRVTGAGRWTPGKPVYVLARVVEVGGKLHHLNALAVASTNDVTLAHTETLSKAVSNQPVAMRGLEGVPGLSLNSAVRWIVSFNRGMDNASAQSLARSVLMSCANYGVDARLALSLFAAESAFRTDAVSGAGAQGLGQLMPGTAGMLGVRNPFNPFENADASIRHLGYLLSHWRGTRQQVEFALAAYNAGAGAVEQYNGIPPYAETVAYVKTILGYYTELARYP